MIHHYVEQRTDDWSRLRWGKLCSTDAAALLATKKRDGAPTAANLALRDRLVAEMLTPYAHEQSFVSRDMLHGIECEEEAINAYEAHHGVVVQKGGFIEHDAIPAGCSPDGIIGDFAGLVEIKCPRPATHLGYLRDGGLPAEYHPQVLHHLVISGVPWVDFVSYAPEFPPHLQLLIVRYVPTLDQVKSYELVLRMFLSEVAREVESFSLAATA